MVYLWVALASSELWHRPCLRVWCIVLYVYVCVYIYISNCTSTVLYVVESLESINMTSIYGAGNCGFQVYTNHGKTSRISPKNQLLQSHVLRFSANVSLTLYREQSHKTAVLVAVFPGIPELGYSTTARESTGETAVGRWCAKLRLFTNKSWDSSPTKIMNEANIAGDIWSCKRQHS